LRERGEAADASPRTSGDDFRGLSDRLCRQYKGASLEEVYDARVEQTRYGPCLHLVDRVSPFQLQLPDPTAAETAVLSEFRLIYGIGPVTAELLLAAGVGRITDLVGHDRFGESAASLVQWWERKDVVALHDLIRHRLEGDAHRLGLLLAGLFSPDQFVMVDLETLGLVGAPVILFGFAYPSGGSLEIHQYLARAGAEESAALDLALDTLGRSEAMVTYNGWTADAAWLRQRSAYFDMGPVPDRLHLDLLYPTRRRYRAAEFEGDVLADFRLPTVERFVLGLERDMDDVPGSEVPWFYQQYERRKNIGPLVPIIDHNRADLIAVARLLGLLSQDATSRW
jgi:uncharacterized protein YprB with RNaseH-like and TPR domain